MIDVYQELKKEAFWRVGKNESPMILMLVTSTHVFLWDFLKLYFFFNAKQRCKMQSKMNIFSQGNLGLAPVKPVVGRKFTNLPWELRRFVLPATCGQEPTDHQSQIWWIEVCTFGLPSLLDPGTTEPYWWCHWRCHPTSVVRPEEMKSMNQEDPRSHFLRRFERFFRTLACTWWNFTDIECQ